MTTSETPPIQDQTVDNGRGRAKPTSPSASGVAGLPGRAPGAVRHRVKWVDRLAAAHHAGRLQDELVRLGRYPCLLVDEVGYIPFEPEAANLFFQLVSSRYERASLIVTSNKVFGRWARCSATTSSPAR